jgi:hypothetical protein
MAISPDKVRVMVTMPITLRDELKRLSDFEDRSLSYCIVGILKSYLKLKNKQNYIKKTPPQK